MMNHVFLLIGVGPAGNSCVFKTVRPSERVRRPFCPEVHLSEWDRQGAREAAQIVGESVLRLLKIDHQHALAAFPGLTPPTGDEGLTKEQIIAAEREAERAERVTALAPFMFDGDMREARVAVGVGFDNRSLRLVPFSGEMEDGVAEIIPLDALSLQPVADAWVQLGRTLLRKVAAMHPDAFSPFDSLTEFFDGEQ